MNIFGIAIVYALLKVALKAPLFISGAAGAAMETAQTVASTLNFGTNWSLAKLQGAAKPLIGE
jgi:hypothetical protein